MNQPLSKNPSDFLKQALGRLVTVKLTNNTEYRGILICLDQNLNIALEQCEEISNNQVTQRYGDAFIRGNNGNINLIIVLFINSAQVKANK
jgi:U6 snRNA-associated Sm-like protein LSm6